MEQDYDSWTEQDSIRRPAGSNLSFDSVAALVMTEAYHEALRKMIGFKFENHPVHPVSSKRLDALNRFITERIRQLLAIPPVDDRQLTSSLRDVLPTDAVIPACC